MITELTPEQEALIPKYADKWVSVASRPMNHEKAIKYTSKLYKEMEEAEPLIIFGCSPYNTALLCALFFTEDLKFDKKKLKSKLKIHLKSKLSSKLRSNFKIQLTKQIRSSIDSPIRKQLYNQLYNQLDRQLGQLTKQIRSSIDSHLNIQISHLNKQLNSQMGRHIHSNLNSQITSKLYSPINRQTKQINQITKQIYNQLYRQIDSQLGQINRQLNSQIDSNLDSNLNSNLNSQLKEINSDWYLGFWWLAWCGWYEYGKMIGVEFDNDKYDLFMNFNSEVHFIIPYKGVAFISEKPTAIHWQNKMLHRDGGQAVEYSDGYGMHCLNGVAVPEYLAVTPEGELDIDFYIKEQNADVRTEFVRKFGVDRMLHMGKKIDDHTNYSEEWWTKSEYELWDMAPLFPGLDTAPHLRMTNQTTGTIHVEPVHPDCDTLPKAVQDRLGGRELKITNIK